jgi:hypothetical protein
MGWRPVGRSGPQGEPTARLFADAQHSRSSQHPQEQDEQRQKNTGCFHINFLRVAPAYRPVFWPVPTGLPDFTYYASGQPHFEGTSKQQDFAPICSWQMGQGERVQSPATVRVSGDSPNRTG